MTLILLLLVLFQRIESRPIRFVFDTAPKCGFDRTEQVKRSNSKSKQDKWDKPVITWHLENYPSKTTLTKPQIKEDISKSFAKWEEYIFVSFQEKNDTSADIVLKFGSRKHKGCPFPFDGPYGFAAHAFYPKDGGNIHFDDDEVIIRQYFVLI